MEVRKKIELKNYVNSLNDYNVKDVIDGKFIVVLDGKCEGIMNENYDELIKPEYKYIYRKNGYFVCIRYFGDIDVYNESGILITSYDSKSSMYGYEENDNSYLIYCDDDHKYIRIDLDSIHDAKSIGGFHKLNLYKDATIGLSYKDGKEFFGFITKDGNMRDYDFNRWPYNKNISYTVYNDGLVIKTDKVIALLDKDGNEIVKVRKYRNLEKCACFNEKLILKTQDRVIIIDKNGSKETYDGYTFDIRDNILVISSNIIKNSKKYIYTKDSKKYVFDYIFSNEIASNDDKNYLKFMNETGFGIIDSISGNIVIDNQSNTIGDIKNDIGIIRDNDKVGFINLKSNFKLDPKYKLSNDYDINYGFSDDYVFFLIKEDGNNKAVIIDSKTGLEIKKFDFSKEYTSLKYLKNDVILLTSDNGNKLYNIKTDNLVNSTYSRGLPFEYGYAKVKDEEGRFGIIDSNFNEVVPTLFDDIKILNSERIIIDGKIVDIKNVKYDLSLSLYSDNNIKIYERKFKKKENLDAAYNYFTDEIEEYEKRKDKYAAKIENEFSNVFKDEDIRKIKRNVKVK